MAGSGLSFRAVYDAHVEFTWRFIATHRVPPEAVADIVQEVFVVVYQRLESFEGRSSLRTWVAGIALNVLRAYQRKRSHRDLGTSLDDELEPTSPALDPSEIAQLRDAAELLEHVLDRMTELQRTAFVLCELEGLSGAEAAGLLGVNENTLRTRLRGARQLFERAVRAYAGQEAP